MIVLYMLLVPASKNPCNKYDQLLRRITSLNSQLSEKKREVQTLKTVVNHNRCSADNRLKKLQDELDEYKEKSELSKSAQSATPSFSEGNVTFLPTTDFID